MFEPENDIERLLMRASAEPAERPAFARALMDAQIFLVMIAGGTPIGPPDADGKVIIPEGATLTLPSAVRGEEKLIPFFTAPSRARTWFRGDHIIGPDRTRASGPSTTRPSRRCASSTTCRTSACRR